MRGMVLMLIFAAILLAQVPPDSIFPVEHFQYQTKGRRDPFIPLIAGEGKTRGRLNIDNLTLIGIISGDRGRIALVKDGLNKGHILRKGDKVAGGWVSEITSNSVIFAIEHAGIVSRFEIELEKKER
ncbi:hypothetical protein DRP53_03330 [candidate division WOR-3 bacterium]|uniref:Pilus assembly protein PilP n=1 Tax=candidate division WOR-3 bacterium TaxID=2052148 RepID=A0A660SJC5_UNCW3|nr:MAG: hypothetical protein DRP53_03330 [candidate division WOR-3 bacterium]